MSDLLQQYARDPRNVRRQLQEPEEEQVQSAAAEKELKPQPAKKLKK